jgi:hypothetical protein
MYREGYRMPLRRVDPGTLPRWDPLQETYNFQENQRQYQLQQNIDKEQARREGSVGRFSPRLPLLKPEEGENIQLGQIKKQDIAVRSGPNFSGATPTGYWGKDPAWSQLSSYEKAAAMSLLEADSANGKPDFASARNVLGAMINRADKGGEDLGEHVSKRIYQPTTEPTQYRRLQSIVELPEFQALTRLAEARDTGQVDDWVDGNTHFLAHEPVMERLREQEPNKYKSWVNWTGYDKGGGQYSNPDGSSVFRDRSHAFLAPEGRHSADRGPLVDVEGQGSGTPSRPFQSEGEAPASSYPASGSRGDSGMSGEAARSGGGTKIPTLAEYLQLPTAFGGERSAKNTFRNPLQAELSPQLQIPGQAASPEEDISQFQIGQRPQRRMPDFGRRG